MGEALADDTKQAAATEEVQENTPVDPTTVAVNVHVQGPAGKDSILLEMVSPLDTIMTLRQMINDYPIFAHHTCFHLELNVPEANVDKWVPMNDFVEFGEYTALLDESTTEFTTRIVLDRYDIRKVRLHVKRFRDTLANPPIPPQGAKTKAVTPAPSKEKSPKEQTQEQIAKLKEVHRKLEGLSIPVEPTLSAFYKPIALEGSTEAKDATNTSGKKSKGKKKPTSPVADANKTKAPEPLPTELPKCIESIIVSGFNPPPGPRKLAGDLCYLEVTLTDGKVLHVTAHVAGFYVNKSSGKKFDPTPAAPHHHLLVDVLTAASSSFSSLYESLLSTAAAWAAAGATSIETMVQAGTHVGLPPWNTVVKANSSSHDFDANRAQDELSVGLDDRGVIRDWNEEFQCARELPHETVREQIVRARVLFKIVSEFVEAATQGAIAIVDGSIPPINPMDEENAFVYVHNHIFFSRAVEGQKHIQSETEASHESAYSSANHDLQGVRAYNAVDVNGLHTLATVVVDYLGQRIIGQSIIPGILQGEASSKLVYGSVDGGKTIVANPEMHEMMLKAGEKLLLAEREIQSGVSIVGPVEAKGILGADNRHYILDLVRITPKDYNYYHGETGVTESLRQALEVPESGKYSALLRPELIQLYARWKTNKDKAEKKEEGQEKTDKAGKNDKEATAEEKAKTDEVAKTEEDAKENFEDAESAIAVRFNANVYMPYPASVDATQAAADEEVAKDAATYLQTLVIPSFVADLRRGAMYPADGTALTDMFHACGINMRYLGHVASLCASFEPHVSKFIVELMEVEMIARSLKHIVASLFAEQPELRSTPGTLLVDVLNALLGDPLPSHKKAIAEDEVTAALDKLSLDPPASRDLTAASLWKRIQEDVASRFAYTLRLWATRKPVKDASFPRVHKMTLLRRVCQRLGWQVASVDYDFDSEAPFNVSHVTGMLPVVKHSMPAHPFAPAATLLERARFFLTQGVLAPAYEMLQEASSYLYQVCGSAHEDSALVCASTASALFHAGDVAGAIASQRRALGLYTQLKGLDYYDTAFAYANLGLYLHANSETADAVAHVKRAIYLLELAAGPHFPETSVLYYKLGMMCHDVGHVHLALACHREALRRGELDRQQAAACLHAMAMTCALAGAFPEALSYEKKVLGLYKEVVGDEDPRVVECMKFIESFTAKAVEGAKDRKVIDAVAAADAVANELVKELELEEKKNQAAASKKNKGKKK
ncbi:unnamed protein product [Aphanomyces euteiches]|uniref:Clu domain-containing protein n=1 Tax=Aphanomyces euteiches TaxID=100861 RepID=A0A6G0XQA7_9STRA|nr:hypothetical protein Ae201684_002485 [Aphanomyces euteiches]KAH9093273.1 hypothetical protein Ae201684P_008931 [Aphanomyces euteiches]KAH9144094.1 hypothetical protein AeRB84_011942 [Aphanomyces euteiches]